ncbi:hypothetical protein [Primorskyibacter sp. S187A]|uniref:hypothetical protein n=1 Tax=Primorskyibacter sp. S187A TaxID=3415130 RepID=UPI003C7A7B01
MTLTQNTFPPRSQHHVAPRYFLIVLVTIAIFALEALISGQMMDRALDVPADLLRPGDDWLEAVGRMRFLAAFMVFGCITLLASCLLVIRLARPMASATRRCAIAVWLLVITLALIPTLTSGPQGTGALAYGKLGAPLFEAVLARGGVTGCVTAADSFLLGACGANPGVALFGGVMDIVNLLAGLSVGALVVGMILCLDARRSDTPDAAARRLAGNLRDMRHQLYLSSLVLTFGMFYATAWMNWPMPLIAEAAQGAYGSLVRASALFTGVYFTLLILSFYLPVALILNLRVRRLAEGARGQDAQPDAFDPEAWMASHSLKEGMGDHLRAGFALIAPILTAFAGGIVPFPF